MIRVLHIGTKLTAAGGIENYVMNLYKGIDRENIQFDFIIIDDGTQQHYEDVVTSMGGIVYKISESDKSIFQSLYERYKIFRMYKQYGIVHIHTSCGIRVIEGLLAKLSGIKKIIFHSHSNSGIPPLKYKVIQPFFRLIGTNLLACSPEAGKYFFGNDVISNDKFKVAKNAINFTEFEYSKEKRKKMQEELNIKDKNVIGFVGRLSKEKNLFFLIDVFEAILRNNPIAQLIIVGDGPLKSELMKYVHDKEISSNVSFLGVRKDIGTIMSFLDLLLLPSFYEGMPVVLIEAQAAGLKCFTSDVVSKESQISDLVSYLSLDLTADQWAKTIIENKFEYERKNMRETVNKSGYSMESAALEMTRLYFEQNEKLKYLKKREG